MGKLDKQQSRIDKIDKVKDREVALLPGQEDAMTETFIDKVDQLQTEVKSLPKARQKEIKGELLRMLKGVNKGNIEVAQVEVDQAIDAWLGEVAGYGPDAMAEAEVKYQIAFLRKMEAEGLVAKIKSHPDGIGSLNDYRTARGRVSKLQSLFKKRYRTDDFKPVLQEKDKQDLAVAEENLRSATEVLEYNNSLLNAAKAKVEAANDELIQAKEDYSTAGGDEEELEKKHASYEAVPEEDADI
ncbi:MAG: hypothetical protein O3B47_01550 [bacterium]|nr:hypothetical protein [bacterium]